MSLEPGHKAPDFSLPATGGRTASLAAHTGRPLVLYFYPKADTPGCTKEAQAFQEHLPDFGATEIIAVSKDKLSALEKFAAKYGLAFPLASDEAGTTVEAYGAWVEKSMYGKTYMGIDRSTILVAPDGTIARIWRKVKVPGHAAEVLAAVKAL